MLIAFFSLIVILLFIPDKGHAATVVRVALFCVVFIIVYRSHVPEDRSINQLNHSRGVKQFMVVRYWVSRVPWWLYKALAYMTIVILISLELFPSKLPD